MTGLTGVKVQKRQEFFKHLNSSGTLVLYKSYLLTYLLTTCSISHNNFETFSVRVFKQISEKMH